MPILLPDQQYFLLTIPVKSNKNYHTLEQRLFLYYLKDANQNIDESSITFQIHNNFKNKLFRHDKIVFPIFFEIDLKNLERTNINNYYSYLLSFKEFEISYQNTHGYFLEYAKLSSKLNIFLFLYQVEYNWIFFDTSFVVLSLKGHLKPEQLIILDLQIDLMNASGFLVILCVHVDHKHHIILEDYLSKIFLLMKNNRFAEIHFDFCPESEVHGKGVAFDYVLQKILDLYETEFHTFFYLYSNYSCSNTPEIHDLLLKLKKNPLVQFILYSVPFDIVFPHTFRHDSLDSDFDPKSRFQFCRHGNDCSMIRINLCDVPLYQSDDEIQDFTPIEMSGRRSCYISKADFLNNFSRVKVIFDDETIRFVDFQDLHILKPELYVENTLFLTLTDNNTLETIDQMHQMIKSDTLNFSRFQFNEIDKSLIQICNQLFKTQGICLHKSQLFASYLAARDLLSNSSKLLNRGTVYQVDTGEGKSYIIQVIALLLALKGKTVHITTSNIALSCEDFQKSKQFIEYFGVTSSVLLHYNELLQIRSEKQSEGATEQNLFLNDPYFSKEAFHNSSNMNIMACGIDNNNHVLKKRSNIVFSTFTNFEGFYLHMMELFPSYISKYFSTCVLIIDEADAILIDEITNGTILSRPMRSNADKVLTFVYTSKMNGKDAQYVKNEIAKKFPKCTDITIGDINKMFQEIDLVNDSNFANGKKYSVETASLEDISQEKWELEDERQSGIMKKVKENIELAKSKIGNSINKLIDSTNEALTQATHAINSDGSEDENEIIDERTLEKKIVVPFDYENKGILEPNKEFSGFVHQFTAIKEKINNEQFKNMIIKNISMNYLYVSHPIFVSLYPFICGFTGTIGNKHDIKVFNEQYQLDTCIIPRNLPNRRVDLPILICKDEKDRNYNIIHEVLQYNKLGHPILIVCQNSQDITSIANELKHFNIHAYLIEGKTFNDRPQDFAGKNGSITIGTNLCGRGTDIKISDKSLHVIVTYYSSNERAIQQAFGRTGRQGMKGTARIICTEKQYIALTSIIDGDSMKEILQEFEIRNVLQTNFIQKFATSRKWIFDNKIAKQDISKHIKTLRSSKINVNRIVAYRYEFPVCMSIDTFLSIQAQKIFSLFNCPNCKYTWMLFQRYVREMILESWSIFIDRSDYEFSLQNQYQTYNDYLLNESEKLYNKLLEYLPITSVKTDIISTFMHIYKKTIANWQSFIIERIPSNSRYSIKHNSFKFCSFNLGFFPFNLYDKSGAQIDLLNGKKPEYISDPELFYLQKRPQGSGFSLLSITQKIDSLFNFICQQINQVIGGFIGLKFFLRRTLGGCEFGICLDLNLDQINIKSDEFQNCLIDKDPMLLFTISLRSPVPLLAGILIILLVYLVRVSGKITQTIMGFPEFAAKKLVEVSIVQILEHTAKNSISKLAENVISIICEFLKGVLMAQIKALSKFNQKLSVFLTELSNIFNPIDMSKINDGFSKPLGNIYSIKCSFTDSISDCIPKQSLLKLGLLIILCSASFMLNFNHISR